MEVEAWTGYPEGWFCVGLSRDLKPGSSKNQSFMGRETVLFHTRKGSWGMLDAHCPHMGTHIGHGGQVTDTGIACPMHGMAFDPEGCSASISTRSYPIREVHGLIMAWYSGNAGEPGWEIPADKIEGLRGYENWNPFKVREEIIHCTPEDVFEVHAADPGHNETLHKELDVKIIEPFETADFSSHIKITMKHPADPVGGLLLKSAGITDGLVETEIGVHTFGLGYQFIESKVEAMGIIVKQFMLPTPIDEKQILLRVVYASPRIENSNAVPKTMKFLPTPIINQVFNVMGYRGLMMAIDEHQPLWEHKVRLANPAFRESDSIASQFKDWTRTFYR